MRSKIAKYLRQVGFRRLQKSVFIGKIKEKKAISLTKKLAPMINNSFDRLCILPISQSSIGNIEAFGQGNDMLTWLSSQPNFSHYL